MKYLLIAFTILVTTQAFAVTLTTLEFDNLALQAKVAAKFPLTKEVISKQHKIDLGTMVLTNPLVHLEPGSDRIGINVDFEFTPNPHIRLLHAHPFRGNLLASTLLRYEPSEGSFYVDNASLDNLEVDHLFELGDEWAQKYINYNLPKWLNDKALYTLQGDAQKWAAREAIQQIEVRKQNGHLIVKLGIGDASPDDAAPNPKDAVPLDDPGVQIWVEPIGP